MFNKILKFINYLDRDFSKAFLGSQSIARNVIKDRFMSMFSGEIDSKEFKVVHGKGEIEDLHTFDESQAEGRGNGTAAYSLSYRLKEIPEEYRRIIYKHREEITKYLGSGFLYERVLVFRTLNMPSVLQTYDVYSNIWHQDSHDGDRLLKIFILLMDVGEDDGPFTYLDRDATLKYWGELAERWSFDKMAKMPKYAEEKSATGKRGNYLIINTAKCMHRGSIPNAYRDMMQITLYPAWRKSEDRKTYNI